MDRNRIDVTVVWLRASRYSPRPNRSLRGVFERQRVGNTPCLTGVQGRPQGRRMSTQRPARLGLTTSYAPSKRRRVRGRAVPGPGPPEAFLATLPDSGPRNAANLRTTEAGPPPLSQCSLPPVHLLLLLREKDTPAASSKGMQEGTCQRRRHAFLFVRPSSGDHAVRRSAGDESRAPQARRRETAGLCLCSMLLCIYIALWHRLQPVNMGMLPKEPGAPFSSCNQAMVSSCHQRVLTGHASNLHQ